MTKKIQASIALVLVSCLAIGGCGSKLDEIPAVAKDIIRECGKEDGAALSRLVLDFLGQVASYVLAGEKIVWTDVEAKAEHEGTMVAQCAFVEIISRFRGAQTVAAASKSGSASTSGSPMHTSAASSIGIGSTDDSDRAVEKLRAATGGFRWRLISGDVR